MSERSVTFAALVENEGYARTRPGRRPGKIAVSLAAELATASEAIQRQAVAEPERAHVLVKQAAPSRARIRTGDETAGPASETLRRDLCRSAVALRGLLARHRPGSRRLEPLSGPGPREIKALDVASIAAPDCVLFLWATAPMLPEALEVMAAWGFEYRTNFVWAKDRARDRLLESQSARAFSSSASEATFRRPLPARSGRA